MTERAIIAQFFRPPHGTTRLHAVTVIHDFTCTDGRVIRTRTEYDVEWSRRYGYYLFHQSGSGGDETVEIDGIFFKSGPAKVEMKPAQWVHGRDKPPWRSKKTRMLRDVNRTRSLIRMPRHIDIKPDEDLLAWIERTGADVDAVYCSNCRDYVRGDYLCEHTWWCDKTCWYSTPAERCECANREECGG